MKLHTNHILIRLTKKTDELHLPGIGAIQIETGYDEERHQRLVGEVVQVPDKLIFENMDHTMMPWECEMEAMVGDEVILRRTDVSVSRFNGKSYEEDGHLFIYVAYEALILVKRKVKLGNYALQVKDPMDKWLTLDGVHYFVIMLNGYMLVEQDDADCETKLSLPQNMKESKAQSGTIRFIGKPNTRYHDQYNSSGKQMSGNLPDDRFDLKVGDRIAFLKFAAIDLEMETHQSFAGKGKQFGRMQRNKVLCKL